MKLKAILFDLDGTLLPMDQDQFVKRYFSLLAATAANLGYEPKQLIDGVWAGTATMIKNDGHCSNETAFWTTFAQLFGREALANKPVFDAFYANEFRQVQDVCGFNPEAAHTVHTLQQAGYTIVLATNPIFPAVATENRIRWTGLQPEDFVLYTTYENARFCKPNLDYYRDIFTQIGCAPEECLMVGNDVTEDMVTTQLGMQVFLLSDCLINKAGVDIAAYPHGSFADLLAFVESLT